MKIFARTYADISQIINKTIACQFLYLLRLLCNIFKIRMCCSTRTEGIIFKSFCFPHKCPPRYSCAIRIMSRPIFFTKAAIFHQALTFIPLLPSSNNKSRALSQLLSPEFLPAHLQPREQSFSRATRRISFQPRLRRAAPVRVYARVSPPARKIAKSINIRAKYLSALLQACPYARDTRGVEPSRCACYSNSYLNSYTRHCSRLSGTLLQVGIILLPNYSAWPPIMRPRRRQR